jgi:type VI secretion system ImpM family protein
MLFGKTPHEPDFVRVDLRTTLALECHRWMAEAVGLLGSEGVASLPARGVPFAFSIASTPERVLIGVMVPSRDRVGRGFPLAAITELASAQLASVWPALPLAWLETLASVRRVLVGAHERPVAAIARDVAAIPLPTESAIDDARRRARCALESAASRDFHQRVLGDRGDDLHYAYHTVRVGAPLGGAPTGPTLLCPVGSPLDVVTWLELVRRLGPPPSRLPVQLPGWFLAPTSRPVLATCLGDPPPSLLSLLAGRTNGSSRIWPLSTASAPARDKAREVIGPLLPPPSAPLSAVLDAIGARRP